MDEKLKRYIMHSRRTLERDMRTLAVVGPLLIGLVVGAVTWAWFG